jgi:hypothetical protein
MAAQVPAEYSPASPKTAKTRVAGDPACRRCRGNGWFNAMAADGMNSHRAECPDCTKHEETLNRTTGQWE